MEYDHLHEHTTINSYSNAPGPKFFGNLCSQTMREFTRNGLKYTQGRETMSKGYGRENEYFRRAETKILEIYAKLIRGTSQTRLTPHCHRIDCSTATQYPVTATTLFPSFSFLFSWLCSMQPRCYAPGHQKAKYQRRINPA